MIFGLNLAPDSRQIGGVDAFVVYWLACSPSERRVEYSNPVRGSQPLLAAKAMHLQPSLHVFGTGLEIGKLREVNPLLVQ